MTNLFARCCLPGKQGYIWMNEMRERASNRRQHYFESQFLWCRFFFSGRSQVPVSPGENYFWECGVFFPAADGFGEEIERQSGETWADNYMPGNWAGLFSYLFNRFVEYWEWLARMCRKAWLLWPLRWVTWLNGLRSGWWRRFSLQGFVAKEQKKKESECATVFHFLQEQLFLKSVEVFDL